MPVVTFSSNADKLAARMRRRRDGFLPAQKRAMRTQTEVLTDEVKRLSGKTYATTKELRRMGHPYARRRWTKNKKFKGVPTLPAPSYIINRQTGRFFDAWKRKVESDQTGVTGTVWNVTSYGKYLRPGGTVKMIGRPIMPTAIKLCYGRMIAPLLEAKRRNEAQR